MNIWPAGVHAALDAAFSVDLDVMGRTLTYPGWWSIQPQTLQVAGGQQVPIVVPPLTRAKRAVLPLYRRGLGLAAGTRRHDAEGGVPDAPADAQDARALAWLPHRGWRGNATRATDHAYLGPIIKELLPWSQVHTAMAVREQQGALPSIAQARRFVPDAGPHHWLDAAWDREADRAVRRARDALARALPQAREALAPLPDATVARAWPWIQENIDTMALFAGFTAAAARLLARVRPHVVITTMETAPPARAVLGAAHWLGIPTAAVQHGWLHPSTGTAYFFTDDMAASGTGLCTVLPDRFLVFGPHERRLLLEAGWERSRVVSTGCAGHDPWLAKERASLAAAVERDDRPLVVWTTQSHALTQDERERAAEAWRQVQHDLPEARVVAKLHPGEPADGSLLAGAPVEVVGAGEDTIAWLAAADVVVARSSTCLLEAIAIGTPVVLLDLEDEGDVTGYEAAGAAERVTDGARLAGALLRAMRARSVPEAARRHIVQEHLHAADGRSAGRVADELRRLMARTPS